MSGTKWMLHLTYFFIYLKLSDVSSINKSVRYSFLHAACDSSVARYIFGGALYFDILYVRERNVMEIALLDIAIHAISKGKSSSRKGAIFQYPKSRFSKPIQDSRSWSFQSDPIRSFIACTTPCTRRDVRVAGVGLDD